MRLMAATPNKGKKWGKDRKPKGACWDCREEGHHKGSDKRKKNKTTDSKGDKPDASKPSRGTANVANESDSEEDGVWVADDTSDCDSLPVLTVVSESDDDDYNECGCC
jgi:hypothetical protein